MIAKLGKAFLLGVLCALAVLSARAAYTLTFTPPLPAVP